jgi:hypothetical protein
MQETLPELVAAMSSQPVADILQIRASQHIWLATRIATAPVSVSRALCRCPCISALARLVATTKRGPPHVPKA